MLLTGTLCALMLAGCDSFYGTTTTVHGTVVDKETGAPLADIQVALTTFGSFGPPVAEASTVTDARGQFNVSTDFDKANTIDLYVNGDILRAMGTYNEAYESYVETASRGRTTRRKIELPPL